jgi:hypothetical protein
MVYFILFTLCLFLQVTHQPTISLNETQFMTNINPLNKTALFKDPVRTAQ